MYLSSFSTKSTIHCFYVYKAAKQHFVRVGQQYIYALEWFGGNKLVSQFWELRIDNVPFHWSIYEKPLLASESDRITPFCSFSLFLFFLYFLSFSYLSFEYMHKNVFFSNFLDVKEIAQVTILKLFPKCNEIFTIEKNINLFSFFLSFLFLLPVQDTDNNKMSFRLNETCFQNAIKSL